MSMEVVVVGLLVLPPVLVGIVGWLAARISAHEERRSEALVGRSLDGYARLGSEAEEPVVGDQRAA